MAGSERIRALNAQWWVAQSRLYATNAGIFVSGGDRACLFDPGIYPDELDEMAAFLDQHRLTADTLILTHSHWDHLYGPARFPQACIVASDRLTATWLAHEKPQRRAMAESEKQAGITREQPFELPVPAETFDGFTTLAVGDDHLELLGAPGHAADQIMIYHRGTATLWAADMLSELEIPFVSHNLAAYRRTLDTVARLDIACLVPGHGTPACEQREIMARVQGDRAYLAALQERVDLAVRSGQSLAETVAACKSIPFRQPREENAAPHQRNVEAAYLEAGGECDNPNIGWMEND